MIGAIVALLAWPAAALAGAYDYSLTAPLNTWKTRNVAHDYSYLRTQNAADFSMCLARGNGISFCGGYFVDHHYADSCNPSTCLTWYLQNTHSGGTYEGLNIHDEWR